MLLLLRLALEPTSADLVLVHQHLDRHRSGLSPVEQHLSVCVQCRTCVTCCLRLNSLLPTVFCDLGGVCCLYTRADRQGVDISFTFCFCLFFVFVWLWISPPRIKLASSHFARRFDCVQGRESYILGNFAPSEAQKSKNRPARGPRPPACKQYIYADIYISSSIQLYRYI